MADTKLGLPVAISNDNICEGKYKKKFILLNLNLALYKELIRSSE